MVRCAAASASAPFVDLLANRGPCLCSGGLVLAHADAAGVPAVLLGCCIGFWLPRSIESATFLSGTQQALLLKAIVGGAAAAGPSAGAAAGTVSRGGCDGADDDVKVEVDCCLHETGHDTEALQLLHRGFSKGSTSGDHSTLGGNKAQQQQQQHLVPLGWSEMGKRVWAVATNKVVLYAGTWRIFHDIPGNGVLYWTPKLVQALLPATGGASSSGVAIVLLSAIPYAAASLVHLVNAWHSQKVGEAKLHISCTWLLGALALLLLPWAAAGTLSGSSNGGTNAGAGTAAFVLLTFAHIGVNGANGLQTGLVAGCLSAAQKALGLAMYNTIACLGAFLGPLLIGVIHDATGGYRVAMWVLGCSLAGAALMVYRFNGNALHKC